MAQRLGRNKETVVAVTAAAETPQADEAGCTAPPWRALLWSPELLIAFAIGARVIQLLWMFSEGFETANSSLVVSDIARYRDIAQGQGVPYRDFAVEFPPVTWVVLWLTGRWSLLTSYCVVIATQFVCEMVAVRYVAKLTGRRGAAYLLILNLPLVMLLYRRIDLLTVALVAAGLYHTLRGSRAAGGILLALSVLGKLWPAVLLPLLPPRRYARVWLWGAVTLLILTAAWVLVAGLEGPRQVLTFRGSTGWQIESLPGNWYLLFTDAPIEWQGGAHRIGHAAAAVRMLLLAALALGLVGLSSVTWRRPDALLVACAAAVLLFLITAPLLSPQYMGWLTAMIALAATTVSNGSRRHGLLITTFLACVVTVIVYPPLYDAFVARGTLPIALVTFRNVLLVTLFVQVVVCLRDKVRHPEEPRLEGWSL